MDIDKKIKYLMQTCEFAMQRWDELSLEEKDALAQTINELGLLSSKRSQQVIQNYEKSFSRLEARFQEVEGILAMHDLFLLERGLGDEFESFQESLFAPEKPKLSLVQ